MQVGIFYQILFTESTYRILIIANIIQDYVWSIWPILKIEILKKLCLKFGNTI